MEGRTDQLRTDLNREVTHFFIKMTSRLILVVFAVILIAVVNAVNADETNDILEANSRQVRGVGKNEKGNKRSNNKKKRRRQRKKKNRKRKGRKGRKSKRKNCPACPGCRQGATDSPMTLECVQDAVSGMKVWKDQVSNFLNRKKRIEKQLKIMDGKFSKRLDFSSISDNITFVGGGDASNLTCSGSNTSSKALTLGSLKTSIDKCNATIGTDCNSTLVMMDISLNSTKLEECFNITTNYTVQADLCMDSDTPCDCWGALVNGESVIEFLILLILSSFWIFRPLICHCQSVQLFHRSQGNCPGKDQVYQLIWRMSRL